MALAAIVLLASGAAAQPFQPGSGFAPLGTQLLHFSNLSSRLRVMQLGSAGWHLQQCLFSACMPDKARIHVSQPASCLARHISICSNLHQSVCMNLYGEAVMTYQQSV